MAIPKTSLRNLKKIRTSVSLLDSGVKAHKAYLRIGSLEMERARKMTEKKTVQDRLAEIERRCAEIDAEKQWLLRAIGESNQRAPVRKSPDSATQKSARQRPATKGGEIAASGAAKTSIPPGPKELTNRRQEHESDRGIISGCSGNAGDGTFTMRY